MGPIVENQNGQLKIDLSDKSKTAVDLRRKVIIINCRLYMFVGTASIIIGAVLFANAHRSAAGISHDPSMNFIAVIMIVFGVIRIFVARKQLSRIKSRS